jgi:methyl-accepting chemotaxis protein
MVDTNGNGKRGVSGFVSDVAHNDILLIITRGVVVLGIGLICYIWVSSQGEQSLRNKAIWDRFEIVTKEMQSRFETTGDKINAVSSSLNVMATNQQALASQLTSITEANASSQKDFADRLGRENERSDKRNDDTNLKLSDTALKIEHLSGQIKCLDASIQNSTHRASCD